MESSLPSDSILEEDGLRVHYFCLLFSSGCNSVTFFAGNVVVPVFFLIVAKFYLPLWYRVSSFSLSDRSNPVARYRTGNVRRDFTVVTKSFFS